MSRSSTLLKVFGIMFNKLYIYTFLFLQSISQKINVTLFYQNQNIILIKQLKQIN